METTKNNLLKKFNIDKYHDDVNNGIRKFILYLEKSDNLEDIEKLKISFVNLKKAIKISFSKEFQDRVISGLAKLITIRKNIISRDNIITLLSQKDKKC